MVLYPHYEATFSILGTSKTDEAKQFASFVKYLKEINTIQDYSEVALLLHSIRSQHSSHYLQALQDSGIPYIAP